MKKVVNTFNVNTYEEEKAELEIIENNTISSYQFDGIISRNNGVISLGTIPEVIVGEDTFSQWANSSLTSLYSS